MTGGRLDDRSGGPECLRRAGLEVPLRSGERLERWPIDRLIPYAKNARTHTDAQIAAIAASIKVWGWTVAGLSS